MEQNARHRSDTIKCVKMDALLFCLNLTSTGFQGFRNKRKYTQTQSRKRGGRKQGGELLRILKSLFFTFSNREEQDDIIWLWDINRKEGRKNLGERQECHERYGYPLLQSQLEQKITRVSTRYNRTWLLLNGNHSAHCFASASFHSPDIMETNQRQLFQTLNAFSGNFRKRNITDPCTSICRWAPCRLQCEAGSQQHQKELTTQCCTLGREKKGIELQRSPNGVSSEQMPGPGEQGTRSPNKASFPP